MIASQEELQSPETLESFCGSVLDISKNIQSVAVIDRMGKTMTKINRPGFAIQFPDHLKELFYMFHVLEISMGKDFDEYYGSINYHVSERTDIMLITFPLGENVMLVMANKNTSPIRLARKIKSLCPHPIC